MLTNKLAPLLQSRYSRYTFGRECFTTEWLTLQHRHRRGTKPTQWWAESSLSLQGLSVSGFEAIIIPTSGRGLLSQYGSSKYFVCRRDCPGWYCTSAPSQCLWCRSTRIDRIGSPASELLQGFQSPTATNYHIQTQHIGSEGHLWIPEILETSNKRGCRSWGLQGSSWYVFKLAYNKYLTICLEYRFHLADLQSTVWPLDTLIGSLKEDLQVQVLIWISAQVTKLCWLEFRHCLCCGYSAATRPGYTQFLANLCLMLNANDCKQLWSEHSLDIWELLLSYQW